MKPARTPLPGRPALQSTTPRFLPDADFLRLKALLIRRTGHFYYEDKDDLLWERVRRRLRALNLGSSGAYLERLADPGRGEAEWAALEAEITVGETFFFRYAEQFTALRETILPDLLKRRRESKRLRIWSAGCANGSEPYSLAILLHELLGDALPEWRIALLGTDLNEAALSTAREGVFSAWSLRSLSSEQRARDFVPVGKNWQLRPIYRAMVRFQRHNLMELLEDGEALEMNEFDLILCRNVLIYFHPETVPPLVRALAGRLAAEGWLLLGHAEPSPAFSAFLQPVPLPGTAAWRREGGELPQLPPAPPAHPALPRLPEIPPPAPLPAPAVAIPPRQPVPAQETPSSPPPPLADANVLEAVRRRADLGDLEGASLACRDALAHEPTNVLLNFYDALLAWAQGQAERAERAFRRTLALRDDFAMAHYQLGLLLLQQGRRMPGRKAIAAAARIVHALPDTAPLEEGDGMTAGELREAARLQLEQR